VFEEIELKPKNISTDHWDRAKGTLFGSTFRLPAIVEGYMIERMDDASVPEFPNCLSLS